MAFEQMSPMDQRIIGECLRAALVFIDLDLGAVTGLDEDDFERIAEAYPDVDDAEETVALTIHGALLNLVFDPHRRESDWSKYISVPKEDLPALHLRWMQLKGWDVPDAETPGEMYFKLMR